MRSNGARARRCGAAAHTTRRGPPLLRQIARDYDAGTANPPFAGNPSRLPVFIVGMPRSG
jgi:hypothetical protein